MSIWNRYMQKKPLDAGEREAFCWIKQKQNEWVLWNFIKLTREFSKAGVERFSHRAIWEIVRAEKIKALIDQRRVSDLNHATSMNDHYLPIVARLTVDFMGSDLPEGFFAFRKRTSARAQAPVVDRQTYGDFIRGD